MSPQGAPGPVARLACPRYCRGGQRGPDARASLPPPSVHRDLLPSSGPLPPSKFSIPVIRNGSAALDDPPSHTCEICLQHTRINLKNGPLEGPFELRTHSRCCFGLHCFRSRRVFGHDLLAFLGDIMSSVMALLDVFRDMRLRLRRLNSLRRCRRGRSLSKDRSAQAQSSHGGECECKLVHGYSPWDRGRQKHFASPLNLISLSSST